MRAHERGFTLIEVLLSVILISMIAGLSLPVYNSFQSRTDLDIATEGIANLYRRAGLYASGSQQDSTWSVRVEVGNAVLYKGATYAARDTSYDESITLPATYGVSLSGLTTDTAFAKLTGAPGSTGTLTITGNNNETRTVTLNGKGMVAY